MLTQFSIQKCFQRSALFSFNSLNHVFVLCPIIPVLFPFLLYFKLRCRKINDTMELNCVDRSDGSSTAASAHLIRCCGIYDKSPKSQPKSDLFFFYRPTPTCSTGYTHKSSPDTRPPARRIRSVKCMDEMEERGGSALTSSSSPKLKPF